MSGIKVDQETTDLYNEMTLRHSYKYATFKIEGKKVIVPDVKGDANHTVNAEDDKVCFDALKVLLTREPRYIVYDFGFTNKEGRQISKIGFIFW